MTEPLERLLFDVFKAQGVLDAESLARKAAGDADIDRRNQKIYDLTGSGLTNLAVAQRYGISERRVEQIVARVHALKMKIA